MEKQLKAIILLVSVGLVRPELYFSELKLNWFGATTVKRIENTFNCNYGFVICHARC